MSLKSLTVRTAATVTLGVLALAGLAGPASAADPTWRVRHDGAVAGGTYQVMMLKTYPPIYWVTVTGALRTRADDNRCYQVQVLGSAVDSPRNWRVAGQRCGGGLAAVAHQIEMRAPEYFAPKLRICYLDPADADTCGPSMTIPNPDEQDQPRTV